MKERITIYNMIGTRQGVQEYAAEHFPLEYSTVREIRRQLYLNRVVIALNSKGELGYVTSCYVCDVNRPPYWYASVIVVPKFYSLPWNISDCKFYYKGDNDRIKAITGKVA